MNLRNAVDFPTFYIHKLNFLGQKMERSAFFLQSLTTAYKNLNICQLGAAKRGKNPVSALQGVII